MGFAWLLPFVLAVEAIGIAAYPYAARLFPALPDRGWSVAKLLGIVVLALSCWLVGLVVPGGYGPTPVFLQWLAFLVGGLVLVVRHLRRTRDPVNIPWRAVLVSEFVFALVFAFWVWFRLASDGGDFGEKPFELEFWNSIHRSTGFPAEDAWFSGQPIRYYAFGYLQADVVSQFSGQSPGRLLYPYGALIGGMTAQAMWGLVGSLTGASKAPRRWGAAGFALVALLFLGNLAGPLELMARHGWGWPGLYHALQMQALASNYDCSVPSQCDHWYPDRWFWWWTSTRIGSSWEIKEFPFFSMQWGDVHAHVMALPLWMGLLIALRHWTRAAPADARRGAGNGWPAVGVVLFTAALLGTDGWSLPLVCAMVAACAAARLEFPLSSRSIARSAARFGVLGLAVFLLSWPFRAYWPGGNNGLRIIEVQPARAEGFEALHALVSVPVHFLIFWLLVMALPAIWVVASWWRTRSRARALAALAAGLALPLLWAAIELLPKGMGPLGQEAGLARELAARWALGNLAVLAFLAAMLGMSVSNWWRDVQAPRRDTAPPGFLPMLLVMAFGILLACELFFVRDLYIKRVNSVFRFWYQVWMLLGVANGLALARFWDHRWALELPRRAASVALAVGLAGILLLGGIYPVAATLTRTQDSHGLHEDALVYPHLPMSADDRAIAWMDANIQGRPHILEMPGDPYTDAGRVSSRTGLPTILGWIGHEALWRNDWPAVEQRKADARTAYLGDINASARMLKEYDVAWVMVGDVEHHLLVDEAPVGEKEANAGALEKFDCMLDVAFHEGSVTVYRVPDDLDWRITACSVPP